MATSPNYGWLEPDNTDLVKNGALAIRTLGNAIDTTMATMVPKSIVDAKGDLIAATANDTPTRLAVGGNTAPLVADSTTATGLRWDNDAWISYTPTWTASGTAPTLGNGTILGKYKQRGKVVIAIYYLKLGSTSTVGTGNYFFSLPVTAQGTGLHTIGTGYIVDNSTGSFYQTILDNNDSTTAATARLFRTDGFYSVLTTVSHNQPMGWGVDDYITFQITYEAA
jgi:hypothetical protein